MYSNEQFVFVHMFRMAGTTCINQVNMGQVGYHLPYSLLPKQLSHLPVIGTIRNPFDWYLSVYQHCKYLLPDMQTNTFLNFMMDYKHTSMEDTLERLIDPSWMTEKDIDNALKHFPEFYDYQNSRLDNLRKTEFIDYINSGKGFLTWLFDYMFSLNGSVKHMKFCRLESLVDDFKKHTGIQLEDKKDNSFNDLPQSGDILSPKIKNLIKRRDRIYIEQYYPELL